MQRPTRSKTCYSPSLASVSLQACIRYASSSSVMISSAVVSRICIESHYAGLDFDLRLRASLLGARLTSEKHQRARYVYQISRRFTHLTSQLCASVGQRVFTILEGPVWMPRATLPKTGGTELPHADLWLSYWCPRTTRAVSGVQRMVSIFSPGRCHGRKSNLLDTSD